MKIYFLFIEVTFLPKLDLQKTRTHKQILYPYILISKKCVDQQNGQEKIKPRYSMH